MNRDQHHPNPNQEPQFASFGQDRVKEITGSDKTEQACERQSGPKARPLHKTCSSGVPETNESETVSYSSWSCARALGTQLDQSGSSLP
jgi:hypothetical protein